MVRNAWLVRGMWGLDVFFVFGFMILSGPIFFILALLIEGKNCFKRRKKMKIYWDEKDEQIKDKNGVCRYDQSAILELIGGADERINAHFKLCEEREANLKAQLQCGAKGHKMVFEKSTQNRLTMADLEQAREYMGGGYFKEKEPFIFTCKSCSLEITKTAKELTVKEKEGLAKLGLL